MPQSPLENVLAHWHKLIENFETSPKDFYTSVEVALDRRQIPGLKTSRVHWHEGGILSAERQYLRVVGDRYSFDLCAAPLGTGFFFSSWMTKRPARLVALYLASFAILTVLIQWTLHQALDVMWRGLYSMQLGLFGNALSIVAGPFVLLPLSFLIVLWLIAVAASAGKIGPEEAILTVPIIGWFYEKVFAPETYYRIDTRLMFQSAVQAAMMEVINGLLTAKGLRALNEAEEKPVQRQLVDKRHSIPDETLVAAR